MYKIPLFDLNYDESEENAVLEVLKSKWISSGPKCMELEGMMQDLFGVKRALAVSNCTVALHLAMLAVGIKAGDEVIVPSMTFVATVNAIRCVGGTPVFCDIESVEKPNIDSQEIKKLITDRTKAIVVMHYGGFSCDMDEIMAIAKDKEICLIEDACHGPLSEFHGKKLGTIGDIGCFSFFSNKNISTGEGGAVVTNNEKLYEKMKLLRSHGMTTMSYERSTGHAVEYDVVALGYNYRMDDIRSALAISQFAKISQDIKRRKYVRDKYISRLSEIKGIVIPFSDYQEISSSYIFPIVLKNDDSSKENDGSQKRDSIRGELAKVGIQTSVHYPAVHRFKIYAGFATGKLPITEYFADHEISLPMYAKLNDGEIDYICNAVKEAVENRK